MNSFFYSLCNEIYSNSSDRKIAKTKYSHFPENQYGKRLLNTIRNSEEVESTIQWLQEILSGNSNLQRIREMVRVFERVHDEHTEDDVGNSDPDKLSNYTYIPLTSYDVERIKLFIETIDRILISKIKKKKKCSHSVP